MYLRKKVASWVKSAIFAWFRAAQGVTNSLHRAPAPAERRGMGRSPIDTKNKRNIGDSNP